jgi:hypothetical protein
MTMPAKKADNQSSISLTDEEEALRRAMANFKPAKSRRVQPFLSRERQAALLGAKKVRPRGPDARAMRTGL